MDKFARAGIGIGHGKYALLALRLAVGWLYFYAGLSKFLEPGWSAAGYLKAASGPFAQLFLSMSGSVAVDFLVKWGLLLIGLAIMAGAVTRFAAFWGVAITLLFYLSKFPPQHGLVDEHIIYIAAFIALAATGTGRLFGIDGTAFISRLVEKVRWLRWLAA